jgi:lipid-binding SYLF domain-containing protein
MRSRAQGVFAGITLAGAVVQHDSDSTRAIYGRDLSFESILSGKVRAPKATLSFMKAIDETGRAGTVAEVSADKK